MDSNIGLTGTTRQVPCIAMKDVTFAFGARAPVLAVSDLTVAAGEKVFVHGPSGSGKSTLLGLIAGVLVPENGTVEVLGHPLADLSAPHRDRLRAEHFGVIFQQFNLVPYLDLVENVLLPCRFSAARAARVGESAKAREAKAREMLVRLGLAQEVANGQVASELSTGQQQRVAAARALIGTPSLIIADEPTSALDTDARAVFIETLLTEAKDASVVFVSHDLSLAGHFGCKISMPEINLAAQNGSISESAAPVRQVGSV
ncbi:MAG: ABC transporter ATP-binding protein [Pseudomonadota bacterium]